MTDLNQTYDGETIPEDVGATEAKKREINYISIPDSYDGPLKKGGEFPYLTRQTRATKQSPDSFEVRLPLPTCLNDPNCTVKELDEQLQELYGKNADLEKLVRKGVRTVSYSADSSCSADFFSVPKGEEFSYEKHYTEEKHLKMQANFEAIELGTRQPGAGRAKLEEEKALAAETQARDIYDMLKADPERASMVPDTFEEFMALGK